MKKTSRIATTKSHEHKGEYTKITADDNNSGVIILHSQGKDIKLLPGESAIVPIYSLTLEATKPNHGVTL